MKNYLILLLSLILGTNSFAQEGSTLPDYNTFLKETQITDTENHKMDIIWWIPVEFWEIALSKQEDISQAQVDELKKILEPYVIFAIVKGTSGEFGDFTFLPLEAYEGKVTAINSKGKTKEPILFDDLSPSVQTILSMVKPILKNAMGQMGENMHFFVFDEQVKKDKRNFNPLEEGEITLNVLDETYSWSTPLSSLLPLKVCPVDASEWNGSWFYCPIHGNELVETED